MFNQNPMKWRLFVLSLCCAIATCSAANAVTLYVPSQYPTIQSAVNAAPANSTISIAPGTYNESPNLSSKDHITIRGNGGKPVLNGGFNLTNCTNITFQTLESHNSISGGVNAVGGGNITVTDLTAVGGWACVVMASFAPNMTGTISNCTAVNTALGMDLADGVNPSIFSCTVSNVRYWGIHCFRGFGTANIVASTVSGSGYSNIYIDADKDTNGDKYFSSDYVYINQCIANASVGYYGIELRGLHSGLVYQCSASGNKSYGMAAYYCDQPAFKSCISDHNFDGFDFFTCPSGLADHCLAHHNVASGFVALTADPAYGAASIKILNCTAANQLSGVYMLTGWSVEIRNSILANNNYGFFQNGSTHVFEDYNDFFGNIGLGAGYWYYGGHSLQLDPSLTADYHLTGQSPCIDVGDPNSIYNDPDGSRSDMGAFYVPHLSNQSIKLVTGYDGTSADGIVCDNLMGMDDSLKDRLRITLTDYPDADFTGSQVIGPSPGHLEMPSSGVLNYYPPDEFNVNQTPSGTGDLTPDATRQISLIVRFKSRGIYYIVNPKTIILARPPVVLVHGINSDPSKWQDLLIGLQSNLGIRIPFAFVDHSDQMGGNGPVEYGAWKLSQTINAVLTYVRTGQPLPMGSVSRQVILLPNGPAVIYQQGDFTDYSNYNFPSSQGLHLAIRRTDVIGWSYGGVIARWFIASDGSDPSSHNDPAKSWYKRLYNISAPNLPAYNGSIRKLFTLGSMWRGVPLVNYLNEVAFNGIPSPSGVYLGDAPVDGNIIHTVINGFSFNNTSLKQVVDFIDGNAIRTTVPSMEVMAVNSPWQSYMMFGNAFPRVGPLLSQPFNPSIAYGSVAGDDEAYLGYDGLDVFAPYALIDQAQNPSWFPYLRKEHHAGASRNYSDGLVPLWSAAIPGSYKISPVNHSNYPKDPDTQAYLAQWLNNSNLPLGKDLTGQWSSSVQSFDKSMTWSFVSGEMAPHTQNMLYVQLGGIGRLNPSAILGSNLVKPVIKISRVGTPTLGANGVAFTLSVSNTGAPANNFTVTSISFYQSLLGSRFPYIVSPIQPISSLTSTQTLSVGAFSLMPIFPVHLFCTVNYQCYDQQGSLISGSTGSLMLK